MPDEPSFNECEKNEQEFDEYVSWSDLGYPEKPVSVKDVNWLGYANYVGVEQCHIDRARELGGNPSVLVRDITAEVGDSECPVSTWTIVALVEEGIYKR